MTKGKQMSFVVCANISGLIDQLNYCQALKANVPDRLVMSTMAQHSKYWLFPGYMSPAIPSNIVIL